MKNIIFLLALLIVILTCSLFIHRSSNDCTLNYLKGKVISTPVYAPARQVIDGLGLSHTKFKIKTDRSGKVYLVYVNNLYAKDFKAGAEQVPFSFQRAITKGRPIQLCGDAGLYHKRLAIHWVHTNCGTDRHGKGYLKIFGKDLTDSTKYCYLFR